MKIIIRDDDTSFFTRPDLLDRIYGRLWERGHAVCLAVIPAQDSSTIVEHRPARPYDPSIPPQYRGQAVGHPVLENRELCVYLNQQARAGLVEICLHGYAHSYMEFASEDAVALKRKLADGQQILSEALPDAAIQTFIAPYDVISRPALELAYEAGLHLCTNSSNLAPFPSLVHIGPYTGQRLANGLKLFACDEYLFTHRDDPDASLASARERLASAQVLIVANHYWTFFYDWDGPNEAMLDRWYRFVDEVLAGHEGDLTTFSACPVPDVDGQP